MPPLSGAEAQFVVEQGGAWVPPRKCYCFSELFVIKTRSRRSPDQKEGLVSVPIQSQPAWSTAGEWHLGNDETRRMNERMASDLQCRHLADAFATEETKERSLLYRH